MSQNLDDKLREILGKTTDIYTIDPEITEDEAIAQIHQAYKKAGYIDLKTATLHDWDEQGARYIKIDGNTYLRGQEWYDRFEKELVGKVGKDNLVAWQEETLELAKRAAGLEDNHGN